MLQGVLIMIIPHAKPGSSIRNKTGNWKVMQPVLDKSKCIKCALCQFYCPEVCISGMESGVKDFPKFDNEYCKGCGICANVCPKAAINMEKEGK